MGNSHLINLIPKRERERHFCLFLFFLACFMFYFISRGLYFRCLRGNRCHPHREGTNDYRVLVRVKIIIKILYGSPLYWPPFRKVGSVGLQKVLPCYHLVHANQKDLTAMELTSAEVVKSGGVWSGILPWAKCQ